jgi:CheY-like chemotaxis protein
VVDEAQLLTGRENADIDGNKSNLTLVTLPAARLIFAKDEFGMGTLGQVTPEPLVLIVEDDLSTRVLYREHLSHSGFRTIDAHNGRQALAKAQEFGPDAILTDLAVPGMDGFEFCRALQESAATRAIPILAVTGHSEYLHDPDRFRHAGIAHVLTKPCHPDRIAEELRRLLREPTPHHL